jgi:serine/threonine-protein kinase RsbW
MTSSTKYTNTLEIVSQPQSINIIEKVIDDLKNEYDIHEDSYGNILVAVTEAVNNAIVHGNGLDPQKQVKVSYEVDGDRIMFTIADQGKGFDYYNLPDPTAPENLEKPTGRGVFLMKHLADQVIFSENGKVVELYFKTHNDTLA